MTTRPRLYTAIIRDHLQRNRQMALVSGSRQVGKTTACRAAGDIYLNWDNVDHRRQNSSIPSENGNCHGGCALTSFQSKATFNRRPN